MAEHKTVFISYRRTNIYIARAVYQDLRANGYDVFLDYQSIDSGDFSQVILNQIAARAHFVLILTPSALERCVNSDDMVRQEIEYAIDLKRNFVPLIFEGFDFKVVEPYLVSDNLKQLSKYNGLRVHEDYFEEAMMRLRTRFLNLPMQGVLHPTPKDDQPVVAANIQRTESIPQPTSGQLKAEEYFERGFVKHQRGDIEGAIEAYTNAISINPSFHQAYYRRLVAYRNIGEKNDALEDIQTILSFHETDQERNIYQSIYYSIQGDYDRALAEAEKGVRRNPHTPEAYFIRAGAREDKGDLDGSFEDLSKAIELNPIYADAYYERGILRNEGDDFDGAIADLSEVIRLYPHSARAYNKRGDVRYNQSDFDGALSDYEIAVNINPDYAAAKRNLQLVLKKKRLSK